MDNANFPGFNYRMTEIQAAVGIEQLKKLKQIITGNKLRYKKLEKLNKKFNVRFNHPGAEPSYDTFIFYTKNKIQMKKILLILKKNKIGTKNLPGALKWHFAGNWKHIFSKYEREKFNKCKEVLNKCIAIPILLKKNVAYYENLATEILSIK